MTPPGTVDVQKPRETSDGSLDTEAWCRLFVASRSVYWRPGHPRGEFWLDDLDSDDAPTIEHARIEP